MVISYGKHLHLNGHTKRHFDVFGGWVGFKETCVLFCCYKVLYCVNNKNIPHFDVNWEEIETLNRPTA